MSTSEQASGKRRRIILAASSRPLMPRHVQLRFDCTRNGWIILAPERLLLPSETAVAALKLCDGRRTIQVIADLLATEFDAIPAVIQADVLPVLQDLCDNDYLTA